MHSASLPKIYNLFEIVVFELPTVIIHALIHVLSLIMCVVSTKVSDHFTIASAFVSKHLKAYKRIYVEACGEVLDKIHIPKFEFNTI